MKTWITPILLSTLAVGCAQTQTLTFDVAQEQQVATSVKDVLWTPLDLPGKVEFQINKSNQILLNEKSAGPVAGFAVPGDKGSIDIVLESFVGNETSFYAPNVIVLNSRGETVYSNSFDDFEYVPAKLLDNDKFVLEFSIIPDLTGDDLNLLIFTTADDLKGETSVLHPAKAFAIAKDTVPPDIPDPLAKHVAFGSFRLSVDSNEVVNKRVAERTDNIPSGADLKGYYNSAIRKAVEADDIPKALALLEEAKALNVEGAQEAFVEAVNSKK